LKNTRNSGKMKAMTPATSPKVAIIMGSQSDWPTMQAATDLLNQLQISYETKIISAHRTPQLMYDYVQACADRGIEVMIAGAGGAAHLPGMTAALTHLPVIGVPVQSKALQGLDSLLSIVQMPAGIPVATVAIGNAANAGLLAARVLGIKYPEIAERVKHYMLQAKVTVEQQTLPN
jgi:5-(carboxyamino)imidazole ribonucleotide mutase